MTKNAPENGSESPTEDLPLVEIEEGPAGPETAAAKRGRGADLARGVETIRDYVKRLPVTPGVYRMLGADGTALYVGKARNLRRRVYNYTQVSKLPIRLQRMVAETVTMEFVNTHTEVEALLLESNLIKLLAPRYNILLRDDKSFSYLRITKGEDYPQLTKHRGVRSNDADYYGPFASGGAVNRTLTALQRGFMLRNCTDSVFASRTRPCLQHQIKRCTAPCVGRATPEAYQAQVDGARAFLSGKSRDIQNEYVKEMLEASERLDFETAARLRDRIRALTAIQAHQDINAEGVLDDADVVAAYHTAGGACVQVFFFRSGRNNGNRPYFLTHDKQAGPAEVLAAFLAQFYDGKIPPPLIMLSTQPAEADLLAEALSVRAGRKVELAVPQRGEKRRIVEHAETNAKEAWGRRQAESSSQTKLLAGVATAFNLDAPPQRIEVYDNSHVQGAHAVGGMIVAGPEGFIKNAYRKFNIKTPGAAGDDYAMMREVFTRRFERALKEDPERSSESWPDLVLIDGGKGQLTTVMEVMAELGVEDVPLVAIAKGPDRDAGRERFFLPDQEPFQMEPRDPVLYYLQRLRDEAHRYAIGTHRAKRAKAAGKSPLDDAPGIGPTRKKALLLHFGSAREAARAGLADLEKVPGISRAVAKKIYDYFHGEG